MNRLCTLNGESCWRTNLGDIGNGGSGLVWKSPPPPPVVLFGISYLSSFEVELRLDTVLVKQLILLKAIFALALGDFVLSGLKLNMFVLVVLLLCFEDDEQLAGVDILFGVDVLFGLILLSVLFDERGEKGEFGSDSLKERKK